MSFEDSHENPLSTCQEMCGLWCYVCWVGVFSYPPLITGYYDGVVCCCCYLAFMLGLAGVLFYATDCCKNPKRSYLYTSPAVRKQISYDEKSDKDSVLAKDEKSCPSDEKMEKDLLSQNCIYIDAIIDKDENHHAPTVA